MNLWNYLAIGLIVEPQLHQEFGALVEGSPVNGSSFYLVTRQVVENQSTTRLSNADPLTFGELVTRCQGVVHLVRPPVFQPDQVNVLEGSRAYATGIYLAVSVELYRVQPTPVCSLVKVDVRNDKALPFGHLVDLHPAVRALDVSREFFQRRTSTLDGQDPFARLIRIDNDTAANVHRRLIGNSSVHGRHVCHVNVDTAANMNGWLVRDEGVHGFGFIGACSLKQAGGQ